MKKIMSLLSALTLSFSLMSGFSGKLVSAAELEKNVLPGISAEEQEIRAEELGQKFADEKNNSKERSSGISPLSTGYEERWVLESKTLVVSQGVVATKYIDELAINQTKKTTSKFSFSAGTTIKGVKLNIGFESTTEKSFTGPSTTDKLSNGLKANTAIISSVQQGAIYKYRYKIVDGFTGQTLRYVEQNGMVDCGNTLYYQLLNIGSTATIESGTTYNVKTAANKTIIINSMKSNNATYIMF